jgi:hypothetical protein
MLLENSRQRLQIWFRPHPNRRSTHEVIVSQSCETPSLGDFKIPETKSHSGATPTEWHKVYYMGGRWWLPPSLGRGESCESEVARGES